VNELIEGLKRSLASEDARYAYADSVTNTFITGQIKAMREARGLTQERLAELVGTKQSGISRWQNTGYSTCKVDTLRKFAKSFGVRLRISFEEFGTLPTDIGGFSKARLCPRKFEDDPVFKDQPEKQTPARVPDEAATTAGYFTIGDLLKRFPEADFFLRMKKANDAYNAYLASYAEELQKKAVAASRLLENAGITGNMTIAGLMEALNRASQLANERSSNAATEAIGGAAPTPQSETLGTYDDPIGIHLVPKQPPGSLKNPINTEMKIAS